MGNPIIERARLHFSAQGTQSIEVPEWGDETGPLTIYWTPITLSERQKIGNRAREGQTHESLAYAIILKALARDGTPLFTIDDKHSIVNGVDAGVVDRIAGAILAAPSVEDAQKN